MKDAPAFDFYPERWLVGTAALSDAEQLAYLRLLCHQWTMDGLPDDAAVLRRLGGKGVTDAVIEKFPLCDGKRRNGRLEKVREEQRERIRKSREKIEKMNSARCSTRESTRPSTRESTRPLLSASSPLTTHHSPIEVEREPQAQAGPPVSESEAWAFARSLPQSPQWTEAAVGKWWSTRDRDGWHTGGVTPRPITAESWRSDLRASHSWATKTERRRDNELPANKTHVPTESLF